MWLIKRVRLIERMRLKLLYERAKLLMMVLLVLVGEKKRTRVRAVVEQACALWSDSRARRRPWLLVVVVVA